MARLCRPPSSEDPIDVFVGPGSLYVFPSVWLPPHVRVFGGFLSWDGHWVRRLPVSESRLVRTSAAEGFRIFAGDATQPSTTRVLDGLIFEGVALTGVPTPPLIEVEGGPLLVARSRIRAAFAIATPPPLPSLPGWKGPMLSIGSGSTNVAVVGSAIAFRDPYVDSLPLVVVASGAQPTFLLNDFYWPLSFGAAQAFVVEGGAQGVFWGNRFWATGWDEGTDLVFFQTPQAGPTGFAPQVIAGNWIVRAPSSFAWSDGANRGGWAGIEANATNQPSNAAPNLETDDCATSVPDGGWPLPGKGACLGAAGDAGGWLRAIEGQLPISHQFGVRFDYMGRDRPAHGADIGATQSPH